MRCLSFYPESSTLARALFLALALGTAVPMGGAAETGEVAEGASSTTCRFVRVRGRGDDGRLRFWRLSATDILDLEIVVGLPFRLEGEHRVDVELYTPDGHLYRRLTVVRGSATADVSAAPRRKLPDLARPVEVRRDASSLARRASVRISVPVAGTSIVSSSLYGRWTAVAYLDGAADACVAPRTFRLRE